MGFAFSRSAFSNLNCGLRIKLVMTEGNDILCCKAEEKSINCSWQEFLRRKWWIPRFHVTEIDSVGKILSSIIWFEKVVESLIGEPLNLFPFYHQVLRSHLPVGTWAPGHVRSVIAGDIDLYRASPGGQLERPDSEVRVTGWVQLQEPWNLKLRAF
jgi:hypothetical protein